jgi:hypothetical protein
MLLLAALFFGLGIFNSTEGLAATSICIVNFDHNLFVSEAVHRIFDEMDNAEIFDEATPADLKHCFLSQSEEVILLAHSFQVGKSTLLQYEEKNPTTGKRTPTTVHPHFFLRLSSDLRKTGATPPKVFRLVACDIDRLLMTYSGLKNIIEENDIFLDRPPQLNVGLRNLSTFDLFWLDESRQSQRLSSADEVSFVVPTFSLLAFGGGTRKIFGGQFLITYTSLNLGLGHFWLPFTVKSSAFKDLEIGESRRLGEFQPEITFGVLDRFTTRPYGPEMDPITKDLTVASRELRDWSNLGLRIGALSQIRITRLR